MIILHRLNSAKIAVNPDLVERIEANPDTVVTLLDGKKLLVSESMDEVIALITDFRAYVIARSNAVEVLDVPRPDLELISGGEDTRVLPINPDGAN